MPRSSSGPKHEAQTFTLRMTDKEAWAKFRVLAVADGQSTVSRLESLVRENVAANADRLVSLGPIATYGPRRLS